MKKILIFSLAYYPAVGGAEVAIKEITDRIRDLEFHMLTLRFNAADASDERIGNVHVHRIGTGPGYLSKVLFVPHAALAALRLHTQNAFDGAWAMMSYMVLPLVLLRFFGVRLPYALTLQDGDPFEHVFKRPHIRLFLPLLSYGFRHAQVVSVLSTYLSDWARRMGYRHSAVIVPNGADTKRFAASASRDIGREPRDVWLVTSSRLVHKNAVDDVIRALALLPKEVKFLVLGVGPDEMMLRALAKEQGVENRVIFKGFVPHAELPSYLKASDIFIRPSRTEGFGASFPEAFAAGIPVIATQEGGIADFLFDEKRNPDVVPTGWAVDKDDPAGIAEAVKDIIARPDAVTRVVENARALAFEKYDWDRIAREMREKVFAPLFTKA